MMSTPPELMTVFWTTAGLAPDTGEISRFDFRDRVEAAARAGFRGVGLWHTDLEHILQQRTLPEMKAILDDNGVRYLELEFLTDWYLTGERKAASDRRKKMLFEASAALHAKHIKVGDFDHTPCPMPRLVEAFAALCHEAEQYGATIGFEFMRSAMLDNLPDALAMVQAAGAPNGGLVLDTAHVMDLGILYAEISRIPRRYLINVELNDGLLPADPAYDPSNRRFCGEGQFDIRGFINCVSATGYTGPWAVEVFSAEAAALSLDEACARAYRTTRAPFES
jgi:sugar phosphate isomerase/epimerase